MLEIPTVTFLESVWFSARVRYRYFQLEVHSYERVPPYNLRTTLIRETFPILGGLKLSHESGLCKNLGHIIIAEVTPFACLSMGIFCLVRTPYSWHGTIFGFKTLKQPEEESYISAFKIFFNATGDIPTGINCTLSQPDGQPEKCFGVRASNDDIHSSWFDKPITTRYIKLVASDCVSTKCIGSISLIFGNADENRKGNIESSCVSPFGKTSDGFAMGEITAPLFISGLV